MNLSKLQDLRRAKGAALAEYGLIAGLVLVSSIGAVLATGEKTRETFCTAASSLAHATQGQSPLNCLDELGSDVVLGPDESLVDAPVKMTGDFANVLYPNTETGERITMSAVSGAVSSAFWLDTQIVSQDPYEPQREIRSCYLTASAGVPVCGPSGAYSTVSVPVGATAFGYLVSLNQDRSMPWANGVSISVPASGEQDAQSWSITVAREEADPVYDVTFSFDNHVFDIADERWTYAPFAELDGAFNTPLYFHVDRASPALLRRACYTMVTGGDPVCDTNALEYYETTVLEVPAGAKELGLYLNLPVSGTVGSDWTATIPVTLRRGSYASSEEVHAQSVVFTRPNEPAVRDVTFSMADQDFEQDDGGWTYLPFAALEGEFNVPVYFHSERGSTLTQRRVCYTMEIGGDPTCDTNNVTMRDPRVLEVPVGAKEVGLYVALPPTGTIGSDWATTFDLSLRVNDYTSNELYGQSVTITRPNEPIVRDVTFSMADHRFDYDETSWTYVPFAALEGEFNVPIFFHSDYGSTKVPWRLCYAMETGGDAICDTDGIASNEARVLEIPVGAKEVGLYVVLPSTVTTGNDWSTTFDVSLRASAKTSAEIYGQSVVVSRAAAPAE